MDDLFKTLATERPTEAQLTHQVTRVTTDTGLLAGCTCGWSLELMGWDESSRSAIFAGIDRHTS